MKDKVLEETAQHCSPIPLHPRSGAPVRKPGPLSVSFQLWPWAPPSRGPRAALGVLDPLPGTAPPPLLPLVLPPSSYRRQSGGGVWCRGPFIPDQRLAIGLNVFPCNGGVVSWGTGMARGGCMWPEGAGRLGGVGGHAQGETRGQSSIATGRGSCWEGPHGRWERGSPLG